MPADIIEEGNLLSIPRRGLAQHCISQKKTLVITEPLSYTEYDPLVDIDFRDGVVSPIICVPVFNQEDEA